MSELRDKVKEYIDFCAKKLNKEREMVRTIINKHLSAKDEESNVKVHYVVIVEYLQRLDEIDKELESITRCWCRLNNEF